MSEANDKGRQLCRLVDEHMAELLEGTAPDELYDHVAECDRCRDARYDAEQAVELLADAGADFVVPEDLARRVLNAVDADAGGESEPGGPATKRGLADEKSADEKAKADEKSADEKAKADEKSADEKAKAEQEPEEKAEPKDDGKAAEEAAPTTDRMAAPEAEAAKDADEAKADEASSPAAGATQLASPDEQQAAAEASAESEPEPPQAAGSTLTDPYAEGAPETQPEAGAGSGGEVVSLLQRLRQPRTLAISATVGALAVAAAAAAIYLPSGELGLPGLTAAAAPWQGKVVEISRAAGGSGGLEVCAFDGTGCEAAREDQSVPAGKLLKTDDRTRAYVELDDGTRVALDRSTELGLDESADRRGKLTAGAIVADVTKVEGSRVRIDLPHGHLEVLGTKFAVRSLGESVAVDVSRGAVKLVDGEGRGVVVRAGEEGRAYPGMAPYATGAASLSEALSWSETPAEDPAEETAVRGLGELRAKKPGTDEERQGAVRLTDHQVKVRIVDGFARTEVDETFTNTTDEVLEGIYRFPLPPDAQIERLALEVDGKMEEGAFVDRDRAAAIWRGAIVNAAPQRRPIQEEIVWVPGPWKDPALLEWQRGGRFELRIFPIPKQGSRRVVLTYTQVIKPSGRARRYVYPLAHDATGKMKVDRFGLDVAVRGHDPAFGVSSQGYALTGGSGSSQEVERLSYEARDFVPTGDLVLEYALPAKDTEVTAWAYQPTGASLDDDDDDAKADAKKDDDKDQDQVPQIGTEASATGDAPYVALALRPKLPRSTEKLERAFVLVVDASRSMFGERYKRASQLAARTVRELDRLDQFTVLACDSTCRELPGGLKHPGAEAAAEVERFLGTVTPEGASDVTAAVRHARSAASGAAGRAIRVVYIGDGTPTVGPIRPRYIARAVRDAFPSGEGTVTAVAIGTDSDLDALGALARGGGGVVLPYVPGQRLAEATYAILGASYGMGLRDISLDLPAGLVEVAPKQLDTIPPGGEAIVVARMTRPELRGTATLRGKVGAQQFEQRYDLELRATTASGNAFVPRLYAATRIADLEREGTAEARKLAVELSGKFNVASRYTSLLVLESPAMFKAFGLDNTRRVATWTGEEELERSESSGQLDVGPDDADFFAGESKAKKDSLGGFAYGGAAGPAAKSAPRPRAAATMAAPAAPPPAAEAMPADDEWERPVRARRPPGRRMIPMRRIWERIGTVSTARHIPSKAAVGKIAEAENAVRSNENSRTATKELYVLYFLAGQLDDAGRVAERWSEKEAMDPEALTARADLAASEGRRDEAIRILGSVVDVRPGDVPSQRRLARLHRWAGRAALGCRHTMALAQLREADADLLADAVFCARQTGESRLGTDMLAAAEGKVRQAAERALDKRKPDEEKLLGEVRLEAKWQGSGHDLDLALLHPDGHRVSWLGAPTKAIITATDVLSQSREGLALRGAKAGEYIIEIVRAAGDGPVRGELVVRAAGATRTIPFDLTSGQTRLALGLVNIRWQSRLVPM